MKKLLIAAAVALSALSSAHAADVTGNFNVVINLLGKCEINSSATSGAVINDITMSYTSFQATNAQGSTNFNVRCTNNLPYSIALSNTGLEDNAVSLNYTLNLSTASAHASGTNGALTSLAGTGSAQTYYVHGTIASGQAGNCAAFTAGGCSNGAATNRGKVITITY
jgi:opacity protein-like surface antigen